MSLAAAVHKIRILIQRILKLYVECESMANKSRAAKHLYSAWLRAC
jgi:hypothetical protein